MDDLEKFVTSHKAEFDSEEPGADLWKRIEADLPVENRRKIGLKSVLWRAAAVVFIFAAGWAASTMIGKRSVEVPSSVVDMNTPEIRELIEAEAYYTSMIESRQAEVESYLQENPDILRDLKEEFNNLDSAYSALRLDLNENLSQQQIIEAMIQNHRTKVEILNELLKQLKSEQSSNETTYEF